MERTNAVRENQEGVSYIKLYTHLIKYGTEMAVFMSNLIDKYKYFAQQGTLLEGMFFQTHPMQTTATGLSDHQIRQCKRTAIMHRMITTHLRGSRAKEYYKLNLEHADIQPAIEFLDPDVSPRNIQDHRPLKSKDHIIIRLKESSSSPAGEAEDVFSSSSVEKIEENMFEYFWKIYPRKTDKGKTLTEWNKLCKKDERPTWKTIRRAITAQKRTLRWKDDQFIPYPSTYLRESRWLDDPKQMLVREEPDRGREDFIRAERKPIADHLRWDKEDQEKDDAYNYI